MVLAEVVGDVELGCRARLHADRGAVEILDRLHVERAADDECRAVVPVDGGELDAELHVALKRDRRDARQHVDLAGLQRGEPLRGGERREPHLRRVAEHRGGNRAADIDVEASPLPCASGAENPATPVVTPHCTKPLRRTPSSVGVAVDPRACASASGASTVLLVAASEHADRTKAKQ